jgi:hypothetical protein
MYNSLKYRKKILIFYFYKLLNLISIGNNYTLDKYYGRFGNNLQQIGIGYLYAKKNKVNFYSKKHENIKIVSCINDQLSNYLKFFKKRYQFFSLDGSVYNFGQYINLQDDKEYYRDNLHKIFRDIISKKIDFLEDKNIDQQTLVIHLRSGDIFDEKDKYGDYLQNPLVFYNEIISTYSKVLVVTDKSRNNPIIKELEKIDKVTIQSSNLEDDFSTLASAYNLASSGVGSFAISAALVSNKLKNFYCTDLYLENHLNPTMINGNDVNVHIFKITNYLKIGNWISNKENRKTMLSKEVKIQIPESFKKNEG